MGDASFVLKGEINLNMKFSLKLLSILLAFTMIFSQLMPAAYAGGKPSNSGTIDYVALGDSIATGTIHSFLTITP